MSSGVSKARAGGRTASGKVTLADVARVSGVSSITVSRVVNHPEKVSPRVRAVVERAIDQLGYIPNQFASSLASAKSGVIGVAIPSLSNTVFNEVLRGIYDVTGRAGYKVVMVDTHYSAREEEQLVRTLLSQAPEAMIITGGDQTQACRKMLVRAKVPVVQIMGLLDDPIDMNIGFSHWQAGYDVAQQLLLSGRTRVGFIGARMDARVHQRLDGYRTALEQAGCYREELVSTTLQPSSIVLGGEMFRALVAQQGTQLDAVFCCNDDLALGALFESQRMKLRIPEDIALCGFNDTEAAACVNPPLASVHVPRYQMGVSAAQMVLRALEGETIAPQHKKIDIGYELKVRASMYQ